MTFSVHGAWNRRWLTIEGGEHFETQFAVWLQAGPCFADIRVPIHRDAVPRCFAGRSGWDGERYCWAHQVDLEGPDALAGDVGELVSGDNGVGRMLLERGMFPTADAAVRYQQMWVRLPGDDGPAVALEANDGCLVRVGEHAITMVDRRRAGGCFAACYRTLDRQGWQLRAEIGDGAGLPCPDTIPAGWRIAHRGDGTEMPA